MNEHDSNIEPTAPITLDKLLPMLPVRA